ncbi:hypothetical protein B7494_g1420 [Chlorociboria aeruginascens]|nr:hypothetical protein B7494_g1420 [Chlorociboria aeruginascens]
MSESDNGPPIPTMTTPPSGIIDDKTPHCIPFILSHLSLRPNKPLFIGLNGIQGSGKTTLVSSLSLALKEKGIETLVCSIDDFYLTRQDQLRLARENEGNKLVQFRGEPGTHDLPLLYSTLTSLLSNKPTRIPIYDKSLHSGLGDRAPASSFPLINPSSPPLSAVILEGWCVGFRPLPPSTISTLYKLPSKTFHQHKIEDLMFVNENLKGYDFVNEMMDLFIHIDARETEWVYEWRREQEEMLRREKGRGMTEEQVKIFVDGYYPAYELFGEGVRRGVFVEKGEEGKGRQLRLVVGRDRRVESVSVI